MFASCSRRYRVPRERITALGHLTVTSSDFRETLHTTSTDTMPRFSSECPVPKLNLATHNWESPVGYCCFCSNIQKIKPFTKTGHCPGDPMRISRTHIGHFPISHSNEPLHFFCRIPPLPQISTDQLGIVGRISSDVTGFRAAVYNLPSLHILINVRLNYSSMHAVKNFGPCSLGTMKRSSPAERFEKME